jgi:hypothetical protein
MIVPEFHLADATRTRLDPGMYRLAHDAPLSEARRRLEQAGWATAVVDLTDVIEKPAIMGAFADGLRLPDWFGANWDGLEDTLRDLAWWPAGASGRVIFVRGDLAAATNQSGDAAVLRDILRTAIDWWAPTSSPMVVVLAS